MFQQRPMHATSPHLSLYPRYRLFRVGIFYRIYKKGLLHHNAMLPPRSLALAILHVALLLFFVHRPA